MAGHPKNPQTLDSFLKKYKYIKDDKESGDITHTRIGDKKKYMEVHTVFQMNKLNDFMNYIMLRYSKVEQSNILLKSKILKKDQFLLILTFVIKIL